MSDIIKMSKFCDKRKLRLETLRFVIPEVYSLNSYNQAAKDTFIVIVIIQNYIFTYKHYKRENFR